MDIGVVLSLVVTIVRAYYLKSLHSHLLLTHNSVKTGHEIMVQKQRFFIPCRSMSRRKTIYDSFGIFFPFPADCEFGIVINHNAKDLWVRSCAEPDTLNLVSFGISSKYVFARLTSPYSYSIASWKCQAKKRLVKRTRRISSPFS